MPCRARRACRTGRCPRSLAEQQALQKAQAAPVVNLAPFSIQRSMAGKQDKGAHAAAERMQKASHACAPCHLTATRLQAVRCLSSLLHRRYEHEMLM